MNNMPARIAVMAAGLFLALVGLAAVGVFLCVALYAALATALPPVWAALVSAAIVLVLALAVFAAAVAIAGNLNRKSVSEQRNASDIIGEEIGRILGKNVQDYIGKNPRKAAGLAILAGFVIGLSPRLRDAAIKILRG